MKVSILFLFILRFFQSTFEQDYFLSNKTQHLINQMEYSHEIIIRNDEAEFTFTLLNITHVREILEINSYYFSITFIDENRHETQLSITLIETNTSEYHGRLKMMDLEEEGNYIVCVFFFNQSLIISSSRFCHVVSVANTCNLEISETPFNNQQAIILVGATLVLLLFIVIVSIIKAYVNRPRKFEDYMKTFSQSHNENLTTLATIGDERRRRQLQQALGERLREDSVQTIEYDQNTDEQYYNYHGIDNGSFSTIPDR